MKIIRKPYEGIPEMSTSPAGIIFGRGGVVKNGFVGLGCAGSFFYGFRLF